MATSPQGASNGALEPSQAGVGVVVPLSWRLVGSQVLPFYYPESPEAPHFPRDNAC